jgi:hypothetical protein
MGSPDNTPGLSVGVAAGWSELLRKDVLAELERVLASHQFRTSKKCSRFLGHIIQSAVDGRFDRLKERTLGIDVFGREPHYDTNQDPIVRGTAGEVRKRLAQYYLETGASELRFSLPAGSYVPEVHVVKVERPAGPVVLARPRTKHSVRGRSKVVGGALAALFTAAVAAGLWFLLRPAPLNRFWSPVLNQSSILVCMGQPQLYTFRSETANVLNSWFSDASVERTTSPPMTAVPLNEIVPMWDTPVAVADTQAFSRLASLFAQKRILADVRGDRSVSLSDLRRRPSVFIGAFDNHWALSLASELRFYFDTDAKEHTQLIRDRQRPYATDWKLVDAWPPRRDIDMDYALVTRVVNRTTEQTIIILGGIAQFGTEAAAEFVTDPSYFEKALAKAPADWYRKNMQIVLSTRVFSGVSGPPRVIATYFW